MGNYFVKHIPKSENFGRFILKNGTVLSKSINLTQEYFPSNYMFKHHVIKENKSIKAKYIDGIQDNALNNNIESKKASLTEKIQKNNSSNMSFDSLHCNEVNIDQLCLESNQTKINENISPFIDLNIFNSVTWIIITMLCVLFIIHKIKKVITRKPNETKPMNNSLVRQPTEKKSRIEQINFTKNNYGVEEFDSTANTAVEHRNLRKRKTKRIPLMLKRIQEYNKDPIKLRKRRKIKYF